MAKIWGNYAFDLVCVIHPITDEIGNVRQFMPQALYDNRRGLRLSPCGHGPFCKFQIPNNFRSDGVYVLTVDQHAKYIGECLNLSSRFNNGYGNISPRNCYDGGQVTNCRINNLVYTAAMAGDGLELWFYRTQDRKTVELDLIDSLQPSWNRKGIALAD